MRKQKKMSKKINIGVFTEQYPSLENKYASSFVHSRCKAHFTGLSGILIPS